MEKIIRTAKQHQSLLFPIFDVLLNGGNLIIHLYISWFLTTNDYGILNALFSLLFVLMIFGMAFQTYIAKRIPGDIISSSEISEIYRVVYQVMIVMIIALVMMTPLMIVLLRSSVLAYLIVVMTFIIQINLSFYRGILQGQKKFLKLNLSFYIEMTVKFAVLIPILRLYKNVEVTLISVFLGMLASYVVTKKGYERHRIYNITRVSEKSVTIYRGFVQVFSTQFFFYFFTAVVLILTNYYLKNQSGLYALSTRFGQIFIHIGLSVVTVLIPYASEFKSSFKVFKKKVLKILLLFSAGGLVVLLMYALIMPYSIQVFFDSSYVGATQVVIPQALAYYFLSIAFLMASMEMVYGEKRYLFILSGFSIFLMVAINQFHSSIFQIVRLELITYFSMAMVLVIRFLLRRESKC